LVDTAQLLLRHGAIPDVRDSKGETSLHLAARGGYLDIIIMQSLLEYDAITDAPSDNHTTPLHLAVEAGKLDAVRLLLHHGAIVHVQTKLGDTPLHSKGGSHMHNFYSSMAQSFMYGTSLARYHYTMRRGADILTSHGFY